MPLTPESRALLAMVYRVGAPKFHELGPIKARHAFQKMMFAFRPEPVPVASVADIPIPIAQGAPLIVRHYRPAGFDTHKDLPLVIYYHGGGWCVGDTASYDSLCRTLCARAGCAVLSVDYRLAPEHPFPFACEDAFTALRWARGAAGLLGIDPHKIALAGDSAGGNLAIVTALLNRDRLGLPLRQLLLIYPCTQIHSERPSRHTYAQGHFLDYESLVWFFTHYLPCRSWNDWRASPLLAPSLAGLPPVFMVSAECDPLTDDSIAFCTRFEREGGAVRHWIVPGLIHGFVPLGKLFPESDAVLDALADEIKARMAP
jgi:acetyl esterase